MRTVLSAACALLLFAITVPANAAPVPPGGFSLIEITSTGSLTNISLNAEAPGQMGSLFGSTFFRFPVVDVAATTIGHTGGILLQRMMTMLSLSDFVINTAMNRVFAEVNNTGGSILPLFDMVPCTTPGACPLPGGGSSVLTGIGLNLTTEGRNAINNAFPGLNLPANLQFGILKQVEVVPEPGVASLLLMGLFGMSLRARRRTKL